MIEISVKGTGSRVELINDLVDLIQELENTTDDKLAEAISEKPVEVIGTKIKTVLF